MATKKESLKAKAEAKLNEELETRKTHAIMSLLNSKRRHEASIKQIEEEIKSIEESPSDTSFIPEGERIH